MQRDAIKSLFDEVLRQQGKALPDSESVSLRSVGFRSLDFSELALRVEDEIGDEINFEAAELRSMETVDDVLSFFERATN